MKDLLRGVGMSDSTLARGLAQGAGPRDRMRGRSPPTHAHAVTHLASVALGLALPRGMHPCDLRTQRSLPLSPGSNSPAPNRTPGGLLSRRRGRTRWLANAEADHGRAILRRRASAHEPGAGAAAAEE